MLALAARFPADDDVALLAAEGVDLVLCLAFNQRLSKLGADAFVKTILVDGLGVRHLAGEQVVEGAAGLLARQHLTVGDLGEKRLQPRCHCSTPRTWSIAC